MASYRDGGTNSYIRSDGHGYADGDSLTYRHGGADHDRTYCDTRADVDSGADEHAGTDGDAGADGHALCGNQPVS